MAAALFRRRSLAHLLIRHATSSSSTPTPSLRPPLPPPPAHHPHPQLKSSNFANLSRPQSRLTASIAGLDAHPAELNRSKEYANFAHAIEAELSSEQLTAAEDRAHSTHSLLKAPRIQLGDQLIPIKAFYISRSVDLKGLIDEEILEVISYSRNNIVAKFKDRTNGPSAYVDKPGWPAVNSWSTGPFMVVFHYGSVVLLNSGMLEEEEFLNLVKKYCPGHTEEARKDDYKVVVRPTLKTWSQGGHDTIFLRKLDIDNVKVISSILGQSVALEHHLKKADKMVNIFSDLNRTMEEKGTFTMKRKDLFQLVASANNTLADLVLRVRFLERSESAWRDARYAGIWEYLRDEFEMLYRFENCNFKLKTIKKNLAFFLEVLQNRKSDFMEWIIIILISCELSVSIYSILWNNFVVDAGGG